MGATFPRELFWGTNKKSAWEPLLTCQISWEQPKAKWESILPTNFQREGLWLSLLLIS